MKLSEYDKVTKDSGVYLLYDEATTTMKVGMSKCLRQRLQGHSKTLTPWNVDPELFVFYCCNARAIERELIMFMETWDKAGGKEYFRCSSLEEVLRGIEYTINNFQHTAAETEKERLSMVENTVLSVLRDAHRKGRQLLLTEIGDISNISLSTTKRCMDRLLAKGKIKKGYKHVRGFCKQAVYELL